MAKFLAVLMVAVLAGSCTFHTGSVELARMDAVPMSLPDSVVASLDSHLPVSARELSLERQGDSSAEWRREEQVTELVAHRWHLEFPTLIMLNDRYILPIPTIFGPTKESKWRVVHPSRTPYRVSVIHRSFLNFYREMGEYDRNGALTISFRDQTFLSPLFFQVRKRHDHDREYRKTEYSSLLGILFAHARHHFWENRIDTETSVLLGLLFDFSKSKKDGKVDTWEAAAGFGSLWYAIRDPDGSTTQGPLWTFIGWSTRPGVIFAPRLFWTDLW